MFEETEASYTEVRVKAFYFIVKELLGNLCLTPESEKLKTQARRGIEMRNITDTHTKANVDMRVRVHLCVFEKLKLL